jgi:tRNA dimethylallyltransferase
LRAALAELSLVKAEPEAEDSELWSPETRHPTAIFGLDMDRARLYERIDARTEAIVAAGARQEVVRADEAGPSRTARKALGFDEVLGGEVELMQKRSRNYARRQLTWMRKIPNLHRIDRTGLTDAAVAIKIANHLR